MARSIEFKLAMLNFGKGDGPVTINHHYATLEDLQRQTKTLKANPNTTVYANGILTIPRYTPSSLDFFSI